MSDHLPNIYEDNTDYVSDADKQTIVPEYELTEQELQQLNTQLDKLRFKNELYLRAHPELKTMLNDFVKECFDKRPAPSEIASFAIKYFSEEKRQYETLNKPTD